MHRYLFFGHYQNKAFTLAFYLPRGLEKALHCLNQKKYEDIIDACNEEIDSEVEISPEVQNDENQSKLNGTNDSEDEGFPADDSQRGSPPCSGSGDNSEIDPR